MNNPFRYPGLRILIVFFNEPYRDFHLRQIAKLANVSSSTAKRFLDFYSENTLLVKSRRANLVLFKANLENHGFRYMKLSYFMMTVQPLIASLKKTHPTSSIVLYGSCARGEDDPESDIDLLVIGRKTEQVDVSKFEKSVGRKITCLIYTPQEWEEKAQKDKAFYERILVDGIVLHGNLPVVN